MAAVQQLFFLLSGHAPAPRTTEPAADRSPVELMSPRTPASAPVRSMRGGVAPTVAPLAVDELLPIFDAACREEPLQTIRLLLYVRDKKDGLGMRQLFCTLFVHLWRRALSKEDGGAPLRHQLLSLLPRIPDYGSWKDLVLLAQADSTLRAAIVPLFAAQLQEDRQRLLAETGTPPTDASAETAPKSGARPGHRRISTAAKWFPSTHSKYRNSALATEVREILGLTEAAMRKTYLSPLRAHLALIEHVLSSPISPPSVSPPSVSPPDDAAIVPYLVPARAPVSPQAVSPPPIASPIYHEEMPPMLEVTHAPPTTTPPYVPAAAAARYHHALRRRGLTVRTCPPPVTAAAIELAPVQRLYALVQQEVVARSGDLTAIHALRRTITGAPTGDSTVICDLTVAGSSADPLAYQTTALCVALMRGWPHDMYACTVPLSPLAIGQTSPLSTTISSEQYCALTPGALAAVAGRPIIVVSPHTLPAAFREHSSGHLLWWRPCGPPLVRQWCASCTEIHGFHAKLFAAILKGAPPTLEGIIHDELRRYAV